MEEAEPEILDAIVVGAGQSGLAAGYYLRRAGLRFVLLDARPTPAGAWPCYYDSLRLFSTAAGSALPGMALPLPADTYPTRDDLAAYLRAYAARFRLPVVADVRVAAVTRAGSCFDVDACGVTLRTRTLVAASGAFGRPYLPEIPGQASFTGTLLHASAYRRPAPFAGQRVVVVGGGNSAIQIAAELACVADVTLASRRPLHFTPQRIFGRDTFRLLARTGVERLPLGHLGRLRELPVVVDSHGYRAALRRGQPPHRPMFSAFSPAGVIWADGTHAPVDAVIFATGYRADMPYLAPLGALDAAGEPIQRAGVSTTTPGLFVVGLTGQRTIASATLRGVGPDARYVVGQLGRYLRRSSR